MRLTPQAKSLKLGLYEHYKGNKYQVIEVGIHSETKEELVVYKALYGEGLIWVRSLKMFLESVRIDGKSKPRFRYISK